MNALCFSEHASDGLASLSRPLRLSRMSTNAEPHSPDLGVTMVGTTDPLIGMTIDGRYLIERVLGEGGMGLVYRARHVVLNKLIAVKVLRAEVSNNAEVIARFHQEAQSATAIGNQHIIDVLDFGRLPDGATYFVMEYLNGSALTDVIERDAPIAIPRFVHIAKQLCDALGAAHGAGIVHRDLKPDNVFLVKRGQDPDFVKVLDFGIAKVGGSSSKLTQAGQVFGTPHYMAPEQCQGKPVDLRADVYALGIILFELVTGKLPFESESLVGLLTAHMLEAPPPPTSLRADCPPEVEAIILRCLAKDPDDRYADCAAMQADVDGFAAGLPVTYTPRVSGIIESRTSRSSTAPLSSATTLPPAPMPPAPVGGAFKAVAGLVAFGAIGAVAFAAYSFLGPKPPPATTPLAPIVLPTIPTSPVVGAAVSPIVRIVSEPVSAEVTSNGELLGNTPLEIPRPSGSERRELVLSLSGYETRNVTISASTLGSELRFALRREGSTRSTTRTTPRSTGATAPTPPATDTATAAPTPPPPSQDTTQGTPSMRRHTSEVINPWGNN
jgi:serine/threonine protein kinase